MNKGGVKVDDGAEDCHCHTTYDDGLHIVAEPDNKNWRQRCFWQAVQNNEVRFENISSAAAPPKQHGDQCTDDQYKDKTDKGFTDGNADMIKKAFISCHLQHNLKNTGWTAENESVDQMISGCYFPTGQDEDQDEKAHACNEIFLFFPFSKKFFPGCVGNRVQNGRIRHLIHPISH